MPGRSPLCRRSQIDKEAWAEYMYPLHTFTAFGLAILPRKMSPGGRDVHNIE